MSKGEEQPKMVKGREELVENYSGVCPQRTCQVSLLKSGLLRMGPSRPVCAPYQGAEGGMFLLWTLVREPGRVQTEGVEKYYFEQDKIFILQWPHF